MEKPIEVPWDKLDPETLRSVVEEFVTLEGTDYGHQELSLPDKAQQVLAGIKTGDYIIVFDEFSSSVHILTRAQWKLYNL